MAETKDKESKIAEEVANAIEEQVKEESSEEGSAPVVEQMSYLDLFNSYAESAQNLGQIVWVDKLGETSNKINIVRVLGDGTKQLFSITIAEEQELTMKK